jgi:hypothetical protein
MKYTFTLLICLITCFTYGQAVDSLGCTGAVGDMKFSILELPDFQKENGDCWILMDGRNVASSKLGAYGYETIPDPRGVFLRVNDNKLTERRDVDRPIGAVVGSWQADMFRSHAHLYHAGTVPYTTRYTGGDRYLINPGDKWSSSAGGNETRPINMNFHLYIRIN